MLEIRDLRVSFPGPDGHLREVLHGISLALSPGESLGLIGESGSGKSVTALAVLGLLPRSARVTGRIRFDGQDLLGIGDAGLRRIRGTGIGMIFQEPMTALNPAMRVGAQIAEGLRIHRGLSQAEARAEALRLMELTRIPRASERIDSYPHELSGGQRQRVGIAIALALQPRLLIADEPTTALDVTVQAEVLDLLDDLVLETGTALLLISHDLGVIARMTDQALVLRRGEMVEAGPTRDLLHAPRADYTRALIAALPGRRGWRKQVQS